MAQQRARKSATKSRATKSRATKSRATKSRATKSRARKSAATKAGARKGPTATQRAAVRKSYQDVKKAQQTLDLKLKKHTQMVTSMFFAG